MKQRTPHDVLKRAGPARLLGCSKLLLQSCSRSLVALG